MKYYIGIDPDVDASGFCIYNPKTQKIIDARLIKFYPLIDKLKELNESDDEYSVVIDAGWLRKKSNYHFKEDEKQKKYIGEKIAKNVGENHKVGKLIVEYCETLGLTIRLVKPVMKKTTPLGFKFLTKLDVKNQEIIDACMLVLGLR